MDVSTTDADSTVVVSPEVERAVIADALVRHGATPEEADLQAATLVEGDLRGHASHGIRRLPVLCERLRAGVSVSGGGLGERWATESALVIDARRALGPVAAHRALDLVLDRVRSTGIAMASIRDAGHVGMLAPYLERIVGAGCAGIMLTVSEALVHPWGGTTAMVGTNPVGIGIPTAGDPFILDMSTAEVSMGKIHDYAARGEAIPAGWAVDAEGAPTTDAAAAARGAISPFGGAKGYALGLAFEALVGVLAGAEYGRDVHGTLDVDQPPTKGDLLVVFSLDALGATGNLASLSAYLDAVRASGASAPVAVPGDRARRERATRTAGIPLDRAVWERALALRNGD